MCVYLCVFLNMINSWSSDRIGMAISRQRV